MASLACPLCSVSLAPAALESHLRAELAYPAVRCLLCPLRFVDQAEALGHFDGPLARHPGEG